jgi:hypothetical protein
MMLVNSCQGLACAMYPCRPTMITQIHSPDDSVKFLVRIYALGRYSIASSIKI